MPARLKRLTVALSIVTISAGLGATSASAAVLSCGQVITESTVLENDVGPCPNHGIIIGADHITLDLNGHRVFGTPNFYDGAGVLLFRRTGVFVRNGVVSDFDGGVVIEGGGGNIVYGVTAENNIGRSISRNPPIAGTRWGDGIAVLSSVNNNVVNNTARNNGPYSGIGVYSLIDDDHPRETAGTSSGNAIDSNAVLDNRAGRAPGATTSDNDGIRLEPGAVGNYVMRNRVINSSLDGIALFPLSSDNVVSDNVVQFNGFGSNAGRRGSGIWIFNRNQRESVSSNLVTDNAANGIGIQGPVGANAGGTFNNIHDNTSFGNSRLPPLPSPVFGGPTADLRDYNPDCDANNWYANRYGTAIPPCTAFGGTQISSV
jgi:hypothetical protein